MQVWGGGSSWAPPQTLPRAQSQALPSILGRFTSSVRAAPSIHPSNMFDKPLSQPRCNSDQYTVFPKPQLSGYIHRPNISFQDYASWINWNIPVKNSPWRHAGWDRFSENPAWWTRHIWNIQYSELFAPEASILVQNAPKSLAKLGLRPRPRWGSLQRSPRPHSCYGLEMEIYLDNFFWA